MRADICELDNTVSANCVKKEKEIVIFTDGSVQSSNWTSDLFSTYSYIFNVN